MFSLSLGLDLPFLVLALGVTALLVDSALNLKTIVTLSLALRLARLGAVADDPA